MDLVSRITREEKVQKAKSYFVITFSKQWYLIFGGFPHPILIQEYLNYISAGGFNILQYTKETIDGKTTDFIESKIK